MANAGPNTNGSQFFICTVCPFFSFAFVYANGSFRFSRQHVRFACMQVDTPWLDGKHTGTSDHPMTSLFVSAAAHIYMLSPSSHLCLSSITSSVFGKVTSGLDIVDKIEAVGSQSGATKAPVVVADCGEL